MLSKLPAFRYILVGSFMQLSTLPLRITVLCLSGLTYLDVTDCACDD